MTVANLWSQLLANDIDVDAGDSLSISSVDTTGTLGSLLFDPVTRTLQHVADDDAFDALAAGSTAIDRFTYTVTDSAGLSHSATVDVTVTGIADGVVTSGGNGNDLIGGQGNDRLTGGSGADSFRFEASSGNDFIIDFSTSEDRLSFASGTGVRSASTGDYDHDGRSDLMLVLTGGGTVTLSGVASLADVHLDVAATASFTPGVVNTIPDNGVMEKFAGDHFA